MIAKRRAVSLLVSAMSCVMFTMFLAVPTTPASASSRFGVTSSSLARAARDTGDGLCTIANIDAAGGQSNPNWDCGATLEGPTSLSLSPCPTSGVLGSTNVPITAQVLKHYLCTPAFTLSLDFTAQPTTPDTDDHGVPPLSLYSATNDNELLQPGWCPAQITTGVCDSESSVPQRILVLKGTKPGSALLSIQGLPDSCANAQTITSCDYQATLTITLGKPTTVKHPSRKGPLKVSVAYLQRGQPIALKIKGKSPQKDTIQLADEDSGEVAQDVTLKVTVTNAGKKTQTNVTLNGPPSFSYATSEVATTNLPLAVTSGPSPSKDIGTLSPGQSSSPITYVVSVTNNGNFVGSVQVLSTNQGSNTNLVSQGSANLTALPTAYLWLSLSRVAPGLVTAGTQVEISGTITNRSQTQSIDVDPITPIATGNAGGGDLEPTAQTALSDGVILPFAGTLSPGQSTDVEGWVQTAYVPSTRATVTYDPTGSIENADGTETDLTPNQIGLSAGSNEFRIGVDTTDPPPPDSNIDTVVDNFTDATIKGTSIWALNKLQGGLDILQHPVTSATGLAKGVAGFAMGSIQAVGEAASLVSSIYLLGLAANDMSEADRQAWADQIVNDFKQSHLKIAADAASGVYSAVNTWVLTLFSDLDTAYTTGNYNPLASFLGGATASGLTTVEDAVLSDIAFQKFAIGMSYTGQVASNAARSAAAIATERGGLANLVSLEAAIRDTKATAVLGKSIEGISAGTNLLLDGAAALVNSFGLTPRQISELQTYCERNNIIVAVRARSAKAAQLIKDGLAVGKNEIIKLKNVNNIDVQFLGTPSTTSTLLSGLSHSPRPKSRPAPPSKPRTPAPRRSCWHA
jgi:hypothetical protein